MLDILKKAQFCHDFNPIIQIYESHFGKILCLWPGSRFWLEYKKLNPNTPNPIVDKEQLTVHGQLNLFGFHRK